MDSHWKLLSRIKTEMPARIRANLEIVLDESQIVFKQTNERAKADHFGSILFGCVWAVIVPVVLYDHRESLSYLWVFSVVASLWYCYGLLFKNSFPMVETRYFEIDTIKKQLRIPYPTDAKKQRIVNINQIKKLYVEDLHESSGALHATVFSTDTINPTNILVLHDPRFSYDDLKQIGNWLVLICQSVCPNAFIETTSNDGLN